MDVRLATADELEAICEFGATFIPAHYGPSLGPDAAQAQVVKWWAFERISQAIDEARIVVAMEERGLVGIGEWSIYDGTPVIWKLYVHPSNQGEGVGPRLIDAVIHHLPKGVVRLQVETFAVNHRARAFYAKEGFQELHTVEHSDPAMNVIWLERPLVRTGRSASGMT